MQRKEMFYAVIGGIVGAVLTMAAGSFSPLGAQNEVRDAEFRAITCQSIIIKDLGGRVGVSTIIGPLGVVVDGDNGFVSLTANQSGGYVNVYGTGQGGAAMGVNENGGIVYVRDKDDKNCAQIGVTEHGGRIEVLGKGNGKSQASMGVNEYGNGAVSTWDKNGYRIASLR